MARTLVLTVAVLLAAAACAQGRTARGGGDEEPPVALVLDPGGPWCEVPTEAEPAVASAEVPARTPPPAPVLGPPVPAHRPAAPSLPVPRRRVTAEPEALGTPPRKSPEAMARERYLDHPTRVRAAEIVFYCPRPYLREVRLAAEEVTDPRPGRRVAVGGARLACRELVLEAERIVLRVRDEPDADLQITARGDVAFVSDQRGQVIREEGARSLFVTNDRIVPLR